MGEKGHDLVDHLRIKAPTSLTVARLADAFSAFQTQNPRLKLEIVLIDRPVDPVTEGFDIAIGAFPHSFGGVVDEPLCPLKRLLCASPAYLKKHGAPKHPRDLVDHRCLSFLPTGPEWIFDGPRGRISIQVSPLLSSNEGHVLARSAIAGNGIALISHYLVADALREGTLSRCCATFQFPSCGSRPRSPSGGATPPRCKLFARIEERAATGAVRPPRAPPWRRRLLRVQAAERMVWRKSSTFDLIESACCFRAAATVRAASAPASVSPATART